MRSIKQLLEGGTLHLPIETARAGTPLQVTVRNVVRGARISVAGGLPRAANLAREGPIIVTAAPEIVARVIEVPAIGPMLAPAQITVVRVARVTNTSGPVEKEIDEIVAPNIVTESIIAAPAVGNLVLVTENIAVRMIGVSEIATIADPVAASLSIADQADEMANTMAISVTVAQFDLNSTVATQVAAHGVTNLASIGVVDLIAVSLAIVTPAAMTSDIADRGAGGSRIMAADTTVMVIAISSMAPVAAGLDSASGAVKPVVVENGHTADPAGILVLVALEMKAHMVVTSDTMAGRGGTNSPTEMNTVPAMAGLLSVAKMVRGRTDTLPLPGTIDRAPTLNIVDRAKVVRQWIAVQKDVVVLADLVAHMRAALGSADIPRQTGCSNKRIKIKMAS